MNKDNREKYKIVFLLLADVICNMQKNERLIQAIVVPCEKGFIM